ncbi:mCG145191, partial [Mus musculus]
GHRASLLSGLWCYPFPVWVCSQQRGIHGRSLAVAAHAPVSCFCHLTVYLGDDWESVHKECLTQVSFYGHRLLRVTEVITAGLISFRCCHLQHLSPERAGNLPKVTQQGLELLSLASPNSCLPTTTPLPPRHPSAAQVTRREEGKRGRL